MRISLPGKSKSANIKARRTFFGHAAGKIILYCGWVTGVILLALLCLPALGWAQEELPEVPTQPKKVNSKKDQDPRALGLVQLSSSGKATLVPITIRIDGKFHDAASYKANPVPMALESGTVYEGERSGTSVGLFTVNGALRSKAANAVTPWLGTGMWLPAGTDVPKTAMKAESVPRGIETTDQPPRLTKNEKAPQETAKAGTPPSPPAAPTSSAPPSSEPPPSKPSTESKPSASQPSQGSTTPPPSDQTNNQAGDANRPRLRRGKPTQPLPADEDVPGYSKPGSAGKAGKNPTPTPATPAEIVAAKGSVQMYPAISAVGGPDPRSYAFQWLKGEEEERRKQMLDLAKEQLRLYLSHQAKGSIAAVPSGSKNTPTGRRQPSKAPDPVLENVQFRTFDLWANNQPVLILSAEAHLPPPSAMSPAPMANGPTDTDYTITLVARTDIYNNLHKLYAGVTDKYHLDVTPQLELIDAVDADGDGRGELLFRETSDAGSGYVIYRATADTLWKLYDSLNPE